MTSACFFSIALIGWWDNLIHWFVAHAESAWGPAWLGVFAFAESSFFPIPPDLLLIALCLLPAHAGTWSWAMAAAAICSAASVGGGLFGYAIGRYGGRPLLKRLISAEKIAYVEHVFGRYDVWAVGVAGFTPIPYKVFTIASGAFRLNVPRFLLASAISRSARFFSVAALCVLFGQTAKDFVMQYFAWLTLIVAAAMIGGFFALKFLARRASRAAQGTDEGREHGVR